MDLDEGRVVFGAHRPAEEVDDVADPVCGTVVNKFSTHHRLVWQGRAYFFCSEACQAQFSAKPEAFVPAAAASAPAQGGP